MKKKGLDRPFFNLYNRLMNISNMTPEEARAFIRKVIGIPKRVLVGKEREHILLLTNIAEPVRVTNNQRYLCEEYVIGVKRYDLTYGLEDDVIVEVYEDEADM
jgi:hypothetical protein